MEKSIKERPILFNGPMVRALLGGSKTQTRRIVKPQPRIPAGELLCWKDDALTPEQLAEVCPYGKPGDQFWVREAFSGPYCMERSDEYPAMPPGQWPKESPIWYWADGNPDCGDWTRPRPSIHMPRWASRITLEIVSVRVEQLQEISEADCWTEGIEEVMHDFSNEIQIDMAYRLGLCVDDAKPLYAQLWESINGAGSWDANPWVWVVEFKKVTP